MRTPVIVFDVNETLLDLSVLDPLFERHLGSAALRRRWFCEMLLTAMTLNHVGQYESFTAIGRSCLSVVAAETGQDLSRPAADEIVGAIRSLPAHPDAVPGLERLNAVGLPCVALTNSPTDTALAQVRNAGLDRYFGEVISVEECGRLKPAPEVYRSAAQRLGKSRQELVMVAAHTWDLAGAASAGWRTAFVAREGRPPHPLYPAPDVIGPDLQTLAEQICIG